MYQNKSKTTRKQGVKARNRGVNKDGRFYKGFEVF
jgi:hypothetical protein